MSNEREVPRLNVRQPGKVILDDSPEYVPVDDITVDDILELIDLDDPTLAILGIDRDSAVKINETIARLREEYYGKTDGNSEEAD